MSQARFVPPVGPGGIAVAHTVYQKPLSAKQGISSPTAQPTHTSTIDSETEIVLRQDLNVNYATSLTGNQPGALLYDRIRAYDVAQFAEVEGRALPVASYAVSYFRYLLHHDYQVPGYDVALTNATQGYSYYRPIAFVGQRKGVTIQDVCKVQPYAGTGALNSYAENDGASAELDDAEMAIAPFWLARSFGSGISSLIVRGCKGFMIAAANDLNSGFTFKAGGNTYVAEEINDIECRINDVLGSAVMSITGAAAAAYHGSRGQPQDPFTGAAVFLFGDLFQGDPQDVTIAISTAQAVQIAALTTAGIGAIATG